MTIDWLKVCIFYLKTVLKTVHFALTFWALQNLVCSEWIRVVNISPRLGQLNVPSNATAPAPFAFILNQPLVNHFYIVTHHIKAAHMGHQIHCQRHQIEAELQFYSISLLDGDWCRERERERERFALCLFSSVSAVSFSNGWNVGIFNLLWISSCTVSRWCKYMLQLCERLTELLCYSVKVWTIRTC